DIFERLELKEEQFSVFESATEQNMGRLRESVLEVDNSLVLEDTSKKYIENKLRPFSDPISKVNKDHYMQFCKIYGREISEKYCSSLLQKAISPSTTMTNNLGVNDNGDDFIDVNDIDDVDNIDDVNNIDDVDDIIDMEDENKFINELSTEQQNEANDLSLEALFKRVFINAKLTCSTPMEVPYFSSRLYPDVCFHCGNIKILSPTPAS
ncbi:5692_t:CDS:2, partial [Racocetra fulgida]